MAIVTGLSGNEIFCLRKQGIKTYVYNLGNGIIEFLAIGTAVKKMPGITTVSGQLLPQAIIRDRDTFVNSADTASVISLNQPNQSSSSVGWVAGIVIFVFWFVGVLIAIFGH